MVKFEKFVLDNGLKVILHEDKSTPLVAVNLLYHIGAKNELPTKTGFAHLFEHLMFSGSENVSDFDNYIQTAGGDCNAFTNNDVTNYYNIAPANNLETLLWLEADRMVGLNINHRSLDVQRKVVVEEFNETCLNIPYGDAWHHITNLAFKKHPYRWPTIGLIPEHIQEAKLEDVQSFYKNNYCPNNATLVVGGNIEKDTTLELIEKWFADIPAYARIKKEIPQEPQQKEQRRLLQKADVPMNAMYFVFHTVERHHPNFHTIDLISDILASGKSSRLYKSLKKKQKLFVDIDAYVTANFDPGLIIIEGRLTEGVSFETAEKAIWKELEQIKNNEVTEQELLKYKNKAVSALIFNECNVLNRTMNLAFFECLGGAHLMNTETESYQKIKLDDITTIANEYLTRENCSVLMYEKE